MHIRRVTAIIIILTASGTLAGAQELVSPYPTDVRVNVNVAAIAEVTISQEGSEEGLILLAYDEKDSPPGEGFYYGGADVSAIANFDYMVNINWVQDSEWSGTMSILSTPSEFEGPHDALTTAESTITLNSQGLAGTRDDDVPEVDHDGTASATVRADDNEDGPTPGATFGILHVTLTSQ
ncbi:MAG: hypothetical protein R6V07_13900 [Armatimonadota bacterium]